MGCKGAIIISKRDSILRPKSTHKIYYLILPIDGSRGPCFDIIRSERTGFLDSTVPIASIGTIFRISNSVFPCSEICFVAIVLPPLLLRLLLCCNSYHSNGPVFIHNNMIIMKNYYYYSKAPYIKKYINHFLYLFLKYFLYSHYLCHRFVTIKLLLWLLLL